jgi:hypothetical protein
MFFYLKEAEEEIRYNRNSPEKNTRSVCALKKEQRG